MNDFMILCCKISTFNYVLLKFYGRFPLSKIRNHERFDRKTAYLEEVKIRKINDEFWVKLDFFDAYEDALTDLFALFFDLIWLLPIAF